MTTLGPASAREHARRSGSVRSLGTNLGLAKDARDVRRTKIAEKWGVTGVHVVDGIRKLIGVAVVGFAGMRFYATWMELESLVKTRQKVNPEAVMRFPADFTVFLPAVVVALVGWALMDPVRAQGAFMWVWNNVMDRVPFLRPRAAGPASGGGA